ncbi:unnamed protein product [Ectocarpus sp. 12 AP-2014]
MNTCHKFWFSVSVPSLEYRGTMHKRPCYYYNELGEISSRKTPHIMVGPLRLPWYAYSRPPTNPRHQPQQKILNQFVRPFPLLLVYYCRDNIILRAFLNWWENLGCQAR